MGRSQHMFDSVFDMRKSAPLHYLARADNARFSAFILSRPESEFGISNADELGYGGTPRIGMHEGFLREASLALELILKAIIASTRKSGVGIPHTHNLPQLWSEAKLTTLEPFDNYQLFEFYVTMKWSGRYPVAKTRREYESDNDELTRLRIEAQGKSQFGLRVHSLLPTGWNEFERLYQFAFEHFVVVCDEIEVE